LNDLKTRLLNGAWLVYFISVPVGRPFTSWTLILLAVVLLFSVDFKKALALPGLLRELLPFIGFYVVLLAGVFYSANQVFAWQDLSVKLPLLLLPFFFRVSAIPVTSRKVYSTGYIIASAAIAVFLLGNATIRFINGVQNAFYYDIFSFYIHPAYLSLYFVTALILLFENQFIGFRHYEKVRLLMMILLLVCVILLASKAGVLSVILGGLVMLFSDKIVRPKVRWLTVVTGLTLLIGSFIFLPVHKRMIEAYNSLKYPETLSQHQEGTAMRVLAWKTALQISKDYFPLGTGTGDIKDVTVKYYEQSGYNWPLYYRLNAHNQYLQSLAALGIIGLVCLLWIVLRPLFRWEKLSSGSKAFLLILILNLFFESMLEVQNGAVFIGTMIPFFFLKNPDRQ